MTSATLSKHVKTSTGDSTVYIVDDDPDVRRSLSLLVRSVRLSCDVYDSAKSFLAAYDRALPGCLILDVRMPEMTGLQLQREMHDRGISLPIIFITAFAEIPSVTTAMRFGAIDYLPKPFASQVLLERIHEAIAQDAQMREAGARHQRLEARLAVLTEREREVMGLLAAGDSTKVIARKLCISPKTVDNHRTKVFQKLNVDNVAQLVLLVGSDADVFGKEPGAKPPEPWQNAPLSRVYRHSILAPGGERGRSR